MSHEGIWDIRCVDNWSGFIRILTQYISDVWLDVYTVHHESIQVEIVVDLLWNALTIRPNMHRVHCDYVVLMAGGICCVERADLECAPKTHVLMQSSGIQCLITVQCLHDVTVKTQLAWNTGIFEKVFPRTKKGTISDSTLEFGFTWVNKCCVELFAELNWLCDKIRKCHARMSNHCCVLRNQRHCDMCNKCD